MRGCQCGKCGTCRQRFWVRKNRERLNASRRGNPRIHDINNRANKKRRDLDRVLTISEYGGKCVCCGEDEPRFLSVHHVNGDGNQHRLEDKSAANMFIWLRRHGYPKDDYVLLCMNCNWATRYGEPCPHKVQVKVNV